MTEDRGEPRTLRDLIDRMAAIRGEAPFLIAPDGRRVVSFARLQAESRQLGLRLSGWGLAKGDRVAFLSRRPPRQGPSWLPKLLRGWSGA